MLPPAFGGVWSQRLGFKPREEVHIPVSVCLPIMPEQQFVTNWDGINFKTPARNLINEHFCRALAQGGLDHRLACEGSFALQRGFRGFLCLTVKLLSRLNECTAESGLIHWKYKVLRHCALQQMTSL